MDNILEQHVKMKAQNDSSLVSFKDCPNHCVDGKIFDPYTSTFTLCQYCEEKRKALVNGKMVSASGKSLSEELNLEESLMGISFDFNTVIPDFAKKLLKPESIVGVEKEMTQLIEQASIGELPNHSIMFNLGSKCCENNFVYPYMLRLYRSGVSLCPLLTPLELCRLRNLAERGIQQEDNELTYYDLLKRDMCVIDIDAGVTQVGVEAIKGVLQLRGSKLKPTVLITNSWQKHIQIMCSEDDAQYYHIPTLVSVEYTDKVVEAERKRQQAYVPNSPDMRSNITTEEFNRMLGRT